MVQEAGTTLVPEITCQEVVQWASAYLDEHVGDEQRCRIVLHLAICAGCETYVKQIATVRDIVGALPQTIEYPAELHRLRQAFVAQTGRSSSGS